MSGIRFGCQTYTWQISYDQYRDRLNAILDVVAASGFTGVEAEVCMLGPYAGDPLKLKEALNLRGLSLAALTLALPWRGERESDDEQEEADGLLAYLSHFPGTLLILVQLPWHDRNEVLERQRNLLGIINAVAARAASAGIVCAYHPNSPAGSVFRTEEDYKVLFAGLDRRVIGYAPDSGHIANGGMDPVEVFREQRELIRHVHFKDWSGAGGWHPMGKGEIDHPGLVRFLRDSDYEGWIMVEEESAQAESDPNGVTRWNGDYIAGTLHPIAARNDKENRS
ncbi:sugar phosphate isomerase/epimerase family protein [Cohnella sp. GCM10027633]|uniref:sugar phosphate isomerase/epimerase family protein n=1 Tax=unclassified Cohnella TaxID=2636738 RepID=UPI00362DD602